MTVAQASVPPTSDSTMGNAVLVSAHGQRRAKSIQVALIVGSFRYLRQYDSVIGCIETRVHFTSQSSRSEFHVSHPAADRAK